jgi:hypothetical protein
MKREECAIVTRLLTQEQVLKQYLAYFLGASSVFPAKAGGLMSLTVVLAVGLDSSLLTNQSSVWKSAGYYVTFTGSIRDAIAHFRNGDFDLVLLGRSIPTDSRERLTFLIRASGSRIPVVCVTDSSSDSDSFADATITSEPVKLLEDIGEIMARRPRPPAASRAMSRIAS